MQLNYEEKFMREFKPIKVVGNGNFGTVYKC